jgi:vacuolar protein sorting-associated protein 29
MVLVLIIGDLHIPMRCHDLPAKFKKLLVRLISLSRSTFELITSSHFVPQVPGKIGQILCTGNICDKETFDYLRTIAPDVMGVRGEFDEVSLIRKLHSMDIDTAILNDHVRSITRTPISRYRSP